MYLHLYNCQQCANIGSLETTASYIPLYIQSAVQLSTLTWKETIPIGSRRPRPPKYSTEWMEISAAVASRLAERRESLRTRARNMYSPTGSLRPMTLVISGRCLSR